MLTLERIYNFKNNNNTKQKKINFFKKFAVLKDLKLYKKYIFNNVDTFCNNEYHTLKG